MMYSTNDTSELNNQKSQHDKNHQWKGMNGEQFVNSATNAQASGGDKSI